MSKVSTTAEGRDSQEMAKLAQLVAAYAPHDGRFELVIPGVHTIRASTINNPPSRALSKLGLCIVAQGAKRATLGDDVYEYNQSAMAIYSAEVPVVANIINASAEAPYLCLVISIDPPRLAELAMKVFPHGVPKVQDLKAVRIAQRNPDIVRAAIRLMEMMAQPEEAALLAPLVIDEVLLRLLKSPVGPAMAQIGMADTNMHKITRVINWLQVNYAMPIRMEDLAALANMSISSFHQHFKAVTSMSPLQFQKVLRLQEARRLMLTRMMDVTSAGLRVGYLSTSQFSREYSRFFGSAPTQDIAKLMASPAERSVQATG